METTKKKLTVKKASILVLILAIFASIVLLTAFNNNVVAWASGAEQETTIEGTTCSTATLADNFADDTIIVELNKVESFKFRQYTSEDFTELRLESVRDLNVNATRIVQEQITAERARTASVSDRLIDNEVYRRVIVLKLQEKGKQGVLDAIKILEQRDDVISASPDFIQEIRNAPNDPGFATATFNGNTNGRAQWGLQGTTWNIGAVNAWGYTRGSAEVIVGVIDTGIRATHEDLRNRVDAGLSRDYTQSNPVGHIPTDTNGHGSHVAGIIGAQGDNGLGLAGVCWNVTLVQLRVGVSGFGQVASADAIDYATGTFQTNRPIRILSYSSGSGTENAGIRRAILAYPGIFVTAADNSNLDHDTSLDYPTNYSRDAAFVRNNVISVSSLDWTGARPNNRAWGARSVSIFAPGEDILSASITSDTAYRRGSGTSYATPHVSGVAALMLAVNPGLINTPANLKHLLVTSGDTTTISIPGGGTQTVRRLNAHRAVASAAFTATSVSGGVSVVLRNGLTLPANANVVIPDTIAIVGNNTGCSRYWSFRLCQSNPTIPNYNPCECNSYRDRGV